MYIIFVTIRRHAERSGEETNVEQEFKVDAVGDLRGVDFDGREFYNGGLDEASASSGDVGGVEGGIVGGWQREFGRGGRRW